MHHVGDDGPGCVVDAAHCTQARVVMLQECFIKIGERVFVAYDLKMGADALHVCCS